MKRDKISNAVIRRLPRYCRHLAALRREGVERISSSALGDKMGLTASQIRQDLSCFGEFGQQGYGYNVAALRAQIAGILGMDRGLRAILVGVGNIGHALMDNFSFADCGVQLVAAFDIKESLIGSEFNGVPIYDGRKMEEYLQNNKVDIAVLAVPKSVAHAATEELVRSGVEAIWNFTNIELTEPNSTTLVENIHFSDSLLALSYYVAERMDEKAARTDKA